MPSLWGRKPVPLEHSERTEIHTEKCGNLILGRATGGRGPVHNAGGCWPTFQGLPGNVKIDGNRRRATVSGRLTLRHRGHQIERRDAVIQSMDIQLTFDWHSCYRRY